VNQRKKKRSRDNIKRLNGEKVLSGSEERKLKREAKAEQKATEKEARKSKIARKN